MLILQKNLQIYNFYLLYLLQYWSTQQKPETKANMKTFLFATLKRISTEKLKISKAKTGAMTR